MITKPYVAGASSQQSVSVAAAEVNGAADELSVNCTSLFIYERQHTSDYYECVADDACKPTELLYAAPSHHNSQLQHVPQQQQQQLCAGDADDDTVKLQLLSGCGSKAALEYPWMRDKKCASDAMCLSTSLSDRRLKQCLTADTLTPGLSVSSRMNAIRPTERRNQPMTVTLGW